MFDSIEPWLRKWMIDSGSHNLNVCATTFPKHHQNCNSSFKWWLSMSGVTAEAHEVMYPAFYTSKTLVNKLQATQITTSLSDLYFERSYATKLDILFVLHIYIYIYPCSNLWTHFDCRRPTCKMRFMGLTRHGLHRIGLSRIFLSIMSLKISLITLFCVDKLLQG